MAKKLYVGSLSYDTTDESLKNLFAQYGEIASAMIIMDKMSGRSKGFGFVEMSSDEDAQKAIDALNGTEFEGRKIIVNEARPMEERPRRDFNRGGGRGNFGGNRGG
jgi:RNA recognition motif-containing protein